MLLAATLFLVGVFVLVFFTTLLIYIDMYPNLSSKSENEEYIELLVARVIDELKTLTKNKIVYGLLDDKKSNYMATGINIINSKNQKFWSTFVTANGDIRSVVYCSDNINLYSKHLEFPIRLTKSQKEKVKDAFEFCMINNAYAVFGDKEIE